MEDHFYHRIEINSRSVYPILINSVIILSFLWALYHWPYYLPLRIKWGLSSFVTLLFVYWLVCYSKIYHRSRQLSVLHLSEVGDLKALLFSESLNSNPEPNKIEGQLSAWSYVLPFGCYLIVKNSVNRRRELIAIYLDQVSNQDFRRLRRIILRRRQGKAESV